LGENEVVQHLNSQELSGPAKSVGCLAIFPAGIMIATGVGMGQNNTGCSVGKSRGEHFAWMHKCSIQKTNGYRVNGQQFMGTIERCSYKDLLRTVSEMHQSWIKVGWGVNPQGRRTSPTSNKLQDSRELSLFRGANPFHRG
jgi:hypothetical protein